ncbi:signal peptidase II [Arenimonas fontis]|uniref:Signal peptidase II n=1 Tax=Arenimonas fontis TaxID=2608255 RepID=A0A5B2ZCX4_9GAMM|nr:signal peptidase II [Arenimonas fontis]KAA2284962.1 hypothetical protein F0415_06855 [Arenimonas fontis]
MRYPEVAGLSIGLMDVIPRILVAAIYEPSQGDVFGPFLIANVHNSRETIALGLSTMDGFQIGMVIIMGLYLLTMMAARMLRADNLGFRLGRMALAVAMGVALLNMGEWVLTAKVTDYVGVMSGTRFWAINLGDLALGMSMVGFPALLAWGVLQALLPRLAQLEGREP